MLGCFLFPEQQDHVSVLWQEERVLNLKLDLTFVTRLISTKQFVLPSLSSKMSLDLNKKFTTAWFLVPGWTLLWSFQFITTDSHYCALFLQFSDNLFLRSWISKPLVCRGPEITVLCVQHILSWRCMCCWLETENKYTTSKRLVEILLQMDHMWSQ